MRVGDYLLVVIGRRCRPARPAPWRRLIALGNDDLKARCE